MTPRAQAAPVPRRAPDLSRRRLLGFGQLFVVVGQRQVDRFGRVLALLRSTLTREQLVLDDPELLPVVEPAQHNTPLS